jgi:hypothetical protein
VSNSVQIGFRTCSDPKRVWNKYIQDYVYVSCGKCPSCRNRKSNILMNRISEEFKLHKYSFLVTLDYDNDHLPVYAFDSEKNAFVHSRSGEILPLREISSFHFPIQAANSLQFGVLYKQDVQLFIKRLRKRIYKNVLQKFISYEYIYPLKKNGSTRSLHGKTLRQRITIRNEEYYQKFGSPHDYYRKFCKLRYFVCGEYGPTTFRPHYHLIVWLDNYELSRNIFSYIRESWSFTDCGLWFETDKRDGKYKRFKQCDSKSASYLSKYLTSYSNLDDVLKLQSTRPFYLASNNPSLGYSTQMEELAYDSFRRGITKYIANTSSEPTFRNFTYSIENRCFPKCSGYSLLSFNRKLQVYGFAFYCEEKGIKMPPICSNWLDFIKTLPKTDELLNFYYNFANPDYENDWSYQDKHCTWACLKYCRLFNSNPYYYVKNIERYYSAKEHEQLFAWYQLQDTYASCYGSAKSICVGYSNLPFILPCFFDSHLYGDIRLILSSLGLRLDSLYNSDNRLVANWKDVISDDFISQAYRDSISQKCSDNIKVKKCNEYKDNLPDNLVYF